MKRRINYTNCYCLVITITFFILAFSLISITSSLLGTIDSLENRIERLENKQKSEVVRDYQSMIQLHD